MRVPMKLDIQKGALHRQLGMAQKKKIPMRTLLQLAKSKNPKTRKRANFAINARSWNH